jgi:hypothetical protein
MNDDPVFGGYPKKSPVVLFYRDPLDCVEYLFSSPLLKGHITLVPKRQWTKDNYIRRIYREWMSSDTAWAMQVGIVP